MTRYEPLTVSVATLNLPALYAEGWRLITIAGRTAYLERPLPPSIPIPAES